ncbi:hypothetical protein EYD10_12279, partial [Varanus komodoensis]
MAAQCNPLPIILCPASEGLSQNDSDSESLAQERQYQLELQKRICESEELVGQSDDGLEQDSLEEDSLEEQSSAGEEELEVGETQRIPKRSGCGKENSREASAQEEIVDRYSELRYNPDWKNSKEEAVFVELDELHQEDEEEEEILSVVPHHLSCSPSQFRPTCRDHQLLGRPQNIPPAFSRPPLNSCDPPAKVSSRPYRLHNDQKELVAICPFDGGSNQWSDSSSSPVKEFKRKYGKDFIEKNKLTLGLATQQTNTYLQLHGTKEREEPQGQVYQYKRPVVGRTNLSEAVSPKESSLGGSPIHNAFKTQVELRSQDVGCHNILECGNIQTSSSSYAEVSDVEPGGRRGLHHRFYPNPSVPALCPSITDNSKQDSEFATDPANIVPRNGKQNSMNVSIARNSFPLSSYQSSLGLHSPCTGEKKKKYQYLPENSVGSHYQYPYQRTVSEPLSVARHGKRQNLLRHQSISRIHHDGIQRPLKGEVLCQNPRQKYTEKIPGSYASGNSGPSQPPAHDLIRALSPTTRLIQAAERQHREICQLADDHLGGIQFTSMFPPIIQRGESDPQLNKESHKESQPLMNRSNSEGYLLQMEKQKERKEKENRKGSRTKGYMKMDVKLGGLGPDYEMIKEKSEKIKQQKKYAKHVQEHNMKNITSTRKPQPRSEIKSAASRQKALQYAKTIPKPKLFVSRPLEQEPEDEKHPAHTLNGATLPPISSLESLQNRHEKEKQAVAAFKTLHI